MKVRYFKFLALIVFILFACMFGMSSGGYYEYQLRQKKAMTEEDIKRFEEDVKLGKNVDITDYLTNEKLEYNNGISSFNRGLSNKINDAFSGVMKYLFKSINDAVDS